MLAGIPRKYWNQRCCSRPMICLVLVVTSYFSRMEHHATQLLMSVPDGSSNTMSSCLLGVETVQISTVLTICGCDQPTRPALLKQSSARRSELLLLLLEKLVDSMSRRCKAVIKANGYLMHC